MSIPNQLSAYLTDRNRMAAARTRGDCVGGKIRTTATCACGGGRHRLEGRRAAAGRTTTHPPEAAASPLGPRRGWREEEERKARELLDLDLDCWTRAPAERGHTTSHATGGGGART